jgi:hypothetical protein
VPGGFSGRIAALARRPSGRSADFSKIGVHTCLCLKLVGRRAVWVKPSWYAVSIDDRTINPDLERFMAKRMGADTIESRFADIATRRDCEPHSGSGD